MISTNAITKGTIVQESSDTMPKTVSVSKKEQYKNDGTMERVDNSSMASVIEDEDMDGFCMQS